MTYAICTIIARIETVCPMCDVTVPAHTTHRCERRDPATADRRAQLPHHGGRRSTDPAPYARDQDRWR